MDHGDRRPTAERADLVHVDDDVTGRDRGDQPLSHQGARVSVDHADACPSESKRLDPIATAPQQPVSRGRSVPKLSQQELGDAAGTAQAEPSTVEHDRPVGEGRWRARRDYAAILGPMPQEPCTICGGVTEIVDHGGFRFRECRRCGYGQLQADGRQDYWSPAHESDDDAYWTGAKQNYFDSALELLRSMTRGRRLLDIGGGLGVFAERALEHGWDAYTLDISPVVAERAAARVGSDRSLDAVPVAWLGSFDVVTMWCVVAHTRDPESLVQTAWDGSLASRSALGHDTELLVSEAVRVDPEAPSPGTRLWPRSPRQHAPENGGAHVVEKRIRRRAISLPRDHGDLRGSGIQRRALVEGKRWWNRLASVLLRFDLNVMSELRYRPKECGTLATQLLALR